MAELMFGFWPSFDHAPEDHHRRVVFVARHLSPELRDHIVGTSRLPEVIAGRPR